MVYYALKQGGYSTGPYSLDNEMPEKRNYRSRFYRTKLLDKRLKGDG
jgi:hypothetical protein